MFKFAVTFIIIYLQLYCFIILLCRKIREKKYSDDVINDMYALLTAESKDKVEQIFEKIQMADENTAGL